MSRFFVRMCGNSIPEFSNLAKDSCTFHYFEDAVIFAEEMLAKIDARVDDTLATFVILDEDRYLLASFTNRPINAILRNPLDASVTIPVEVTRQVIGMSLNVLHDVQDVDLGASICEFFGVYSLEEVTLRALNFARCREAMQKVVEKTVTIEVKLRLQTSVTANIAELVKNIDVGFNPRVVGSIILGKEITIIN